MNLPWQQSGLHPHALSLIEPDMSGSFGDELAADLAAFNPPEIIHRYRIVAPDRQGADILPALGFTATRLTRVIDLPLDALPHRPLPDCIAAHWFLPHERAPWGDWLDAHWARYQSTHRSYPPCLPKGGTTSIFLGDDLIEGFALRDGPGGRVLAFAILRDGQELGWIGGSPDLLPHVLGACLRRATAIGWTKATLEVDDEDLALWALVAPFTGLSQRFFTTWQKERFGALKRH